MSIQNPVLGFEPSTFRLRERPFSCLPIKFFAKSRRNKCRPFHGNEHVFAVFLFYKNAKSICHFHDLLSFVLSLSLSLSLSVFLRRNHDFKLKLNDNIIIIIRYEMFCQNAQAKMWTKRI